MHRMVRPRTAPETPFSSTSPTTDAQLSTLSTLLNCLDEVQCVQGSGARHRNVVRQNELVQVRLGIANSLFLALRAKHAPTATHSLRVGLGCTSWAMQKDLSREESDHIQIAALLHDIGKIGVPDHVLLKPNQLNVEEALAMDRHREFGLQILRGCCASPSVLDFIRYTPAWFDGSKRGFDRQGAHLPIGSRMIAIVDAFDSMTTDRVYRAAMSQKRATAELLGCSGTQFDPNLVVEFCHLLNAHEIQLDAQSGQIWLDTLRDTNDHSMWRLNDAEGPDNSVSVNDLFHGKLLESMHDGVVFVDTESKILLWNRAAERLTGITNRSVLERRWDPELIELWDEEKNPITTNDCPLAKAVMTGTQSLRRLTVKGHNGNRLAVDAHMVPVVGQEGARFGAALLLHDASSKEVLEERVVTLHRKATQDPLTKVANRAEFDRCLNEMVVSHLSRGAACSLIVCDIDRFKSINDNFGHQAGDEALVSFAKLLRNLCTTGDLVARYGGEEFIMICADSANATTTEKAEEIRLALQCMRHPCLNGHSFTASFGVTELQLGDTPETIFNRADRALLKAKDLGRNRVVQLGPGISGGLPEESDRPTPWFSWLQKTPQTSLLETTLRITLPVHVAVEKLKGFVADHGAKIDAVEENKISLLFDGHSNLLRRGSDRPIPFQVILDLDDRETKSTNLNSLAEHLTLVHVCVSPKRQRDRRRNDLVERAKQLLFSLKAYLMDHESDLETEPLSSPTMQ